MKITGGILSIGDLEVFSSGKRKKSIVVFTFEKQSRHFQIHFYNENIEQLETLDTGDHVVIEFDLQPEIFEDKGSKSYFTHIIGLKILSRKKRY